MSPRRAGERRHLVALQAPTRTPTTTGYQETWATYDYVRAAIRPPRASAIERALLSTTQSPITHEVEIDYHADVRQTHRVLFGARALYVVGQQNVDERNRMMVLACEERAA
jgi:head-tail adaptor